MMRVPRLVPGCDIKSLPLKTEEGYLLSRVDGVVSERELSLITGLSPAEVSIALERLQVLGAVDFGEVRPPVSRRGPTLATGTGGAISTRGAEIPASRAFVDAPLSGPISVTGPISVAGPPASRRYDPTSDLPPPSRRYDPGSDQPPPPTRRSFDIPVDRRPVEAAVERRPMPVQESEPPPATRRGAEITLEPPRRSPEISLEPPRRSPEISLEPSRRGQEISIEAPRRASVEVDEQTDLDEDRKRKINELFDTLDVRTHYELLQLPTDADKKRVKAAYYALAPEYHPDKYFRKRLGPYKAKIEAIFTQYTLAHDVLTSKQRRTEYDTYLEQLRRNRTMAALLEHDPLDVPAVVAAADDDPSNPPPTARRGSAEVDPVGPESARRRLPTSKAPVGLSRRPGMEGQTAGSMGGFGSGAATDAPRRIDTARPDPRALQLERYLLAAKVALERRDVAAAANAYRLAAALAPDDDAIVRKAMEIQRTASNELSEGFLRQAEYEASQGKWAEAAASYAAGCRTKQDDPRMHERVAFATLKTGQNARRAVDYARRAVKLAPQSVEYRLTLVRAYIAAGLETSARAEFDRLAEMGTNDVKLRDAIAQLRSQLKKTDSSEP